MGNKLMDRRVEDMLVAVVLMDIAEAGVVAGSGTRTVILQMIRLSKAVSTVTAVRLVATSDAKEGIANLTSVNVAAVDIVVVVDSTAKTVIIGSLL